MSYSAAAMRDVLAGQGILGSTQENFALAVDSLAGPEADLNVSSTVFSGCTGPSPPWAAGETTMTGIDFALAGHGYTVITGPSLTSFTGSFNQASVLKAAHHLDLVMYMPSVKIRAKKISLTTSQPSLPAPTPFSTCRDLLAARRGLLSSEQFESLGKQLRSLLLDLDEGVQVSIVSLDTLISFLSKHRPPQPNIALTKNGRFTASWTSGRRAKITLTFDHEGGSWVAVNLDDGTRATGAFVINSLDGISQPYRSWVRP